MWFFSRKIGIGFALVLLIAAIAATAFIMKNDFEKVVIEQPVQITTEASPAPLEIAQATAAPLVELVDQLYKKAIEDAIFIDDDEILPIITLTPDSAYVSWNDTMDKVLLLVWHNNENLLKNELTKISGGDLWSFTDKEFLKWYKYNSSGVAEWNLRLKQLLGLSPDTDNQYITGLWVSPDDVLRPAYMSDPKNPTMTKDFPASTDDNFRSWFYQNMLFAYFEKPYPWTRLGYTYDWSDSDTDYGLTEFLIKDGSEVSVEFTYTTDKFINWASEQTVN